MSRLSTSVIDITRRGPRLTQPHQPRSKLLMRLAAWHQPSRLRNCLSEFPVSGFDKDIVLKQFAGKPTYF